MEACDEQPNAFAGIVEEQILRALEEKEAKLDAALAQSENPTEEDLEHIRTQRLAQLKLSRSNREQWLAAGHGKYEELRDEKDFFEVAKKSKKIVVHFSRPTCVRCEIFDKHFTKLAPQLLSIRFIKLNVERCPFLVERLKIFLIPSALLIRDGKTEHTIIGFDEMGGTDDFSTRSLVGVLKKWKMVSAKATMADWDPADQGSDIDD